MKIDRLTKVLLAVIAAALVSIALRPYVAPLPVQAQSSEGYRLYFEPGVNLLRAPDGSRQIYGKVAFDLRTGEIWGFPTGAQDPYPFSTSSSPVTSHPFRLGKFALADIDK